MSASSDWRRERPCLSPQQVPRVHVADRHQLGVQAFALDSGAGIEPGDEDGSHPVGVEPLAHGGRLGVGGHPFFLAQEQHGQVAHPLIVLYEVRNGAGDVAHRRLATLCRHLRRDRRDESPYEAVFGSEPAGITVCTVTSASEAIASSVTSS